jgi:hypothetical protein
VEPSEIGDWSSTLSRIGYSLGGVR